MASSLRTIRTQCLRQPQSWTRRNSSLSHLQTSLPQRRIQPTFEDLTPQTSYRLDMTLSDFLPSSAPPLILPPAHLARELPIGHHLLYFEPSKRPSTMLPDGTNPDQSPGSPFDRRMWAGGRVLYNQDNTFKLDGKRGVCCEFIRDVNIKWSEGDEKIFVSVERRLAKVTDKEVDIMGALIAEDSAPDKREHLDHLIRQRLWRSSEDDFGECSILERRNLVFLRSRTPEQARTDTARSSSSKILKPEHDDPDYSHTITPDSKLLFRFSALTFNAHAIHLDPQYSQQVEGHRNLLFHGPLSYTFLVTLLAQQLGKEGNEVIKSIEYRNLAPLYCDEPVTFSGKKVGQDRWDVWATGPEGGVAVKGKVVTEQGRIDKSNLGI